MFCHTKPCHLHSQCTDIVSLPHQLRLAPVLGCCAASPGGATSAEEWVVRVGLLREEYGTHSLRRTKVALIYKQTGNLRAV